MRFLLDKGHNRFLQGDTGERILNAHSHQDIKVMTWLIEAGAGVDGHPSFSWKPLIQAVVNSRKEVIDLLLAHGADANIQDREGQTALMHSASDCDSDVFHLLLEHGADIHRTDSSGHTVLTYALRRHAAKIVQYLLRLRGVPVDPHSKDGETLLLCEVERNNRSEVQHLLVQGADVNARNGQDQTPLMLGARSSVITSELLQHGAEIEARNTKGETALLLAARNGNEEAVTLLLEHGADVNVTDNEGRTPLSWAKVLSDVSDSYTGIAQRLLAAGAKEPKRVRKRR